MIEHSLALWSRVVGRDAAFDGVFVYAVRTTGVYCRPSCPSRRPLRGNVEFFPTSTMASQSGYRPCRKCRPDALEAPGGHLRAIRQACAAMARRPEESWTTARASRAGGLSVSAMSRAFRRALGLSPAAYVAACRHGRFLQELKGGTRIADALYVAGYGSSSRVYGRAGLTPASYQRGGAGASIEWTTVASPLGRVLVAATAKGACFVAIGADDDEVEAAVHQEFPQASVARGSSSLLRRLASAAAAAARAQPVAWTLPADIVGTAFQWQVWRALTRVPRGKVLTYAALAQAIGRPTAVRAVARACATNPLALVVPCHRVVGSNGSLRGYRWGTERKGRLIEAEKQPVL